MSMVEIMAYRYAFVKQPDKQGSLYQRSGVEKLRSKRHQAELDGWLNAHPEGVRDDGGRLHLPETDLRRIDAATRRMSTRQRAQLQKKQFYATAA